MVCNKIETKKTKSPIENMEVLEHVGHQKRKKKLNENVTEEQNTFDIFNVKALKILLCIKTKIEPDNN